MATSIYFVRSDGHIRGPFDAMRLHKMLQSGQLLWQHELSEDRRHWIKAEKHAMFKDLVALRDREPDLVIEPIAPPVRKGPPPLPTHAQSKPRQAPPPHRNDRSRRDREPILEAELVEEVPTAHLLDLSDTVSDLPAPSLPEMDLFEIDQSRLNEM